jgi:quercetin dioxygenase-like cupin family protein
MNSRQWFCSALVFLGLIVVAGTMPVRAQENTAPVVHPRATMKLGALPSIPTCITGAPESGDPFKGESTILMRFAGGCAVPWHWHTPNETILMISGTLRVDMKGTAKAAYLHAGDYAMAPSHHIHRARCVGAAPCMIFLHSTGAFDIHYVDASGKEIPMSEAIKPAHMARKPAHKSASK